MKEAKKAEVKTKEKKKISIKIVIVLAALIIFALITGITIRAEYLNFTGIGEEYLSVLEQKVTNRCTVFCTAFISIYIFIYILNKFIKREGRLIFAGNGTYGGIRENGVGDQREQIFS